MTTDLIDDDYDAPAQMIPLDHPVAIEWLERLAKNLPPIGVEQGKPLAAMFDPAEYCVRFLTTVGLFFSFHAHAERLIELGDGDDVVYEFTSWTGGLERERGARSLRDLRPELYVE